MPRQFSTDFGNRLAQERNRLEDEDREFKNTLSIFEEETRSLADQFGELHDICDHQRGYCVLKQDIPAEEGPVFERNEELLDRCGENLTSTERRFTALRKRLPTLQKLKSALEKIEALNTIADEEVSVPRMETENASDTTTVGGSTTVEAVERKISSEVDGGSTMETAGDSSTDGKLRVAMIEEQSSEMPAGESNEGECGEVLPSLQTSDFIERVGKISLLFQEVEELFGELEMAKNEFSKL